MEKLITTRQLAEYLGTSVNSLTVMRYMGTLDIPSYKLGRYYRYKMSDVEAWLERHKREVVEKI